MQQPGATAKLVALQKTTAWQQHPLVEKRGWATVPGSTTPHAAGVRACVDQLTKTPTSSGLQGVIRAAHTSAAVRLRSRFSWGAIGLERALPPAVRRSCGSFRSDGIGSQYLVAVMTCWRV
jgi:hypothetical protein